MSRPARAMRPRAGCTKPPMASMHVVLPAPLGPISPTTSRSSTAMSTSATAVTPPYTTVNPRTSSSGPGSWRAAAVAVPVARKPVRGPVAPVTAALRASGAAASGR